MQVKKDFYYEATEQIVDRLQEFYESFYEETLHSTGQGFRLDPCPICGHHDCCSVGEPGVNCFSCGWSGGHIKAYVDYAMNTKGMTRQQALSSVAKFTGVSLEDISKEDEESANRYARMQEIQRKACEFYHDTLLNTTDKFTFRGYEMTPMAYLLNVRMRKQQTINDLMIGFSQHYWDLRTKLIEEGYDEKEIKAAHIWIPEGFFVFFYKDPITKDIRRINTKNPFNCTIDIKNEVDEVVEHKEMAGYSVGEKSAFFYTPKFSFKKPFIIVEGEHDLCACYEQGYENVCCIGGNLKKEYWGILERAQSTIYTAFDNDDTGEKYTLQINEAFPHKDIKRILFSKDYKDIDEYFVSGTGKSIKELIEKAELLHTENYNITHQGFSTWKIENRFRALDFHFQKLNERGQIVGTGNLYANGKLVERCDNTVLVSMKSSMKPMNFLLADEINLFFNTKLRDRENQELISIYPYSSEKMEIRKILAERIIESGKQDEMVVSFKEKLLGRKDSENIIDEILKEVNDIQNKNVASLDEVPKIRITQYFNVKNNDAYFYYTAVKHDGETIRKLPYLLRNDRSTLRLDLYKRKDEQCLLLIDNKYELPMEQPTALNCTTLTQKWAEKWINQEIPKEELNPFLLVSKIESYIKRFYYTTDENVYRIVALYCYMTYYYEVLGEIPYLYLNGEKGSGKSILDTVLLMFCFNAKMGVSISDSALFRMTSVEGGTIILDEVENLTSRTRANDSPMGAVLKGGYAKNSLIYRTNMDKGCVEGFDSFGPKVISNIFGLEDVVLDRCIQINTYRLKITKETRMEDPRHYLSERMDEIKEITSKCCLSALERFQELYRIFRSGVFEAETARLSQILTSMLAVARLVDESEDAPIKSNIYENSLIEFYNSTIKSVKQDVEETTPEGILKTILPTIAKELKGIIPLNECTYTVPSKHKYEEPIEVNNEEGWFKLNVVHLKCFVEESMPGEQVYTRYIPRYIRNILKVADEDMSRASTTIKNEELLKEYRGNASPRVNYYKFYFRDFLEDEDYDILEADNEENTSAPGVF